MPEKTLHEDITAGRVPTPQLQRLGATAAPHGCEWVARGGSGRNPGASLGRFRRCAPSSRGSP
eukprot:2051303-Prymnesium_polylepis.1